MEGDHRRIAAEGIVLRRHLDEARDRLPVGASELELVEPRGRRLRGIERRAHLSRQVRDGCRVPRLFVGHLVAEGLAGFGIVAAEVIAEEIADMRGGEGQFEILAGCRGPLEPSGDGDRQGPVGRKVGLGPHPFERRQPIERGEGHLRGDLVENTRACGTGVVVIEGVAAFLEETKEPLGRGLPVTVVIAGLADRLDGLGRGLVGGEVLKDLHRQGILARSAPQPDLVEEPGGRQFPEAPPLLAEVLQAGEVADDAVEFGPCLLVAFRLEEQPHDPQTLFRTGRIGLAVEDEPQLIARYGPS